RAVVLDLGGGTFDVTVLEIVDGVVEIQASAGDARLGGEDFDAALAEHLAANVQKGQGHDLHRDPRAWARVRDAAERAKKRLSENESTSVALYDLPVGPNRTAHIEAQIGR